jgi:glucose-6-phosphate isomerase
MILKGLDPLQILKGAKQALKDTQDDNIYNNTAYQYACLRHHLNVGERLQIENFIVYDPNLQFVGEM